MSADLNPTFGKVLSGYSPGLEYYSDWGTLPLFLSVADQVHRIVPGGDFHLANNVTWNVGIGFGLTPSGDRLLYKISWRGKAKR